MVGAYSPILGASVKTMDGETIGKVKELQDDYFKVDAPMKPDFWLPRACIGSMPGGEEVRLTCSSSELDEHKVDNPLVT